MATKNLTNGVLMRRFLTGDDEPLCNRTDNGGPSLRTRQAPDGTVLLVGYGHNLYAENRPDGDLIIYEGNREWARDQYPPKKRGVPQSVQHINNLISRAEELDVSFETSDRAPRTAGVPNGAGDLSEIGRLGGFN